jgi:hypothetical protein
MADIQPEPKAQSVEQDILSKVKSDNTTAQLVRCGGCTKPMAQNGAEITEKNYVDIKGKKIANTDKAAKGFLCEACLKDPARSKEGPRESVMLLNDRIMLTNYDNLVEMKEAAKPTAAEVVKEEKPK